MSIWWSSLSLLLYRLHTLDCAFWRGRKRFVKNGHQFRQFIRALVVPFYLQVSHLVGAMTANPPGSEPGWTIGKNQTLALLHGNQWFRGVAVRKTGDRYTIYRVDLGDIVTVPKSFIRPLPPTFCRWNVLFSLSPVILDASCLLPGCLQLAFSAVWLEQTRLRVKTGVWSLLR